MRFVHWFDLAPGDTAQVIVSTDNLASWDVLATFTGASSGWQTYTLDLSAWENCPTPVIVGFDLLARADGGGRPAGSSTCSAWKLAGRGRCKARQRPASNIEGPGRSPGGHRHHPGNAGYYPHRLCRRDLCRQFPHPLPCRQRRRADPAGGSPGLPALAAGGPPQPRRNGGAGYNPGTPELFLSAPQRQQPICHSRRRQQGGLEPSGDGGPGPGG